MAFEIADDNLHQQAGPVVDAAELVDIRTFLLHGEVLDLGAGTDLQPVDELNVNLSMGHDGHTLNYLFEYNITIKGSSGTDVLKVQAQVGALFKLRDEEAEFTEDNLAAFGQTTAHLIVHPYLRLSISDLCARLGFPRVTLGLIKR